MTDDPLELLARANPVPATMPAPPIDGVFARIEAGHADDEALPRPTRRPRPARFAAPALTVAIALAVAAGAIVLVHSGARSRQSVTGPPGAYTGGLVGQVAPTGVALGPAGTVAISVIQCHPCHSRMLGGPLTWTYRLWTTSDGGGSWQVTKRRWFLEHAVFSGEDGWASGIANDPYPDARVVFVTHDGGQTWKRLRVPKTFTRYSVSIAGGKVWAATAACIPDQGCGTVVLRGPAAGDRLTPVHEPGPLGRNVQIAATGADSAYLYVGSPLHHPQVGAYSYTTQNGGRTWQPVHGGCVGTPVVSEGADAVWQSCGTDAGIGRSTDGGRSWEFTAAPFGLKATQLVPISATVAWAMTGSKAIVRTSDGGRTWTRTTLRFPWPQLRQRGGTDAVHTIPPPSAQLAATSADDAAVVTTQPNVDRLGRRSTMLAVYRTTDGGISWHRQVVGVPQH